MTHDQAAGLRTMKLDSHLPDAGPAPRLIAVSGGRPDVGATLVSLHLAMVLAQQGLRTVLVDADLSRADVARRLAVAASPNLADVLAHRRTIHEVLQRGPAGMQLVAGSDSPQCRRHCTERSLERLLVQLRSIGRHADAVVMDAGSDPSDLTDLLWCAAHDVLLVTTPEPVAVLDAYALVKSVCPREDRSWRVHLAVNRASNEAQARDVHARIDRSCRRFLALPVHCVGWLPQLCAPLDVAPASVPPVLTMAMEQVASHFLSSLAELPQAAA
jgi:flagellar biosynthesis protein FlhG